MTGTGVAVETGVSGADEGTTGGAALTAGGTVGVNVGGTGVLVEETTSGGPT